MMIRRRGRPSPNFSPGPSTLSACVMARGRLGGERAGAAGPFIRGMPAACVALALRFRDIGEVTLSARAAPLWPTRPDAAGAALARGMPPRSPWAEGAGVAAAAPSASGRGTASASRPDADGAALARDRLLRLS
eukprot:360121-Chlamydomonas_euryale.AAC.22